MSNLKTPFTNNKPGKKWFKLLLARHPEISVSVLDTLTHSRDKVSETVLRMWFKEISQRGFERSPDNLQSWWGRIFTLFQNWKSFNSKRMQRCLSNCARLRQRISYCTDDNLSWRSCLSTVYSLYLCEITIRSRQ